MKLREADKEPDRATRAGRISILRLSAVVATGFLLCAGALVALSSAALATTSATLFVNASGTATTGCTSGTPCKTIQDAVNEAAGGTYSGDAITIEVAAGTYDENDTIASSSVPSLTIEGTAGAASTFLDGGGKASDIHVGTGSTVVVEGLTVEGGRAIYGGGVFSGYPSSVTLTDDTISGNSAGFAGGGVWNQSTMNLSDDTISGNSATRGGGVAGSGTITITNDTITGNSANTGGGILNDILHSAAVVTNDTITGNSATYEGGGISNTSWLTLADDTITGNSATAGGGVWNLGIGTISDSLLAQNPRGELRRLLHTPHRQWLQRRRRLVVWFRHEER